MLHELRCAFESLNEWRAFVARNPWTYDRAYIEVLVAAVAKAGVVSDFHGRTSPKEVLIEGRNYRETMTVHGCSARVRAVLDELVLTVGSDISARILTLEAVTPFALALRGRYPHALAVEYLPEPADRERFFPIPHCNIMESHLPSDAFDVVVSNDVLEHVSSLENALRETRRILKAGGVCLATFPFASGDENTQVRAVVRNGAIEHIMPPEYHGNPVDPVGGSLVFAVPAWDILDVCRAVGFRGAEIVFVTSSARGITGSDCAGIHILRAVA